MKSLNIYINEKLKLKDIDNSWNPEYLDISPKELTYIDALIIIANRNDKKTVEIVYNSFTSKNTKKSIEGLENLDKNIIKYLNNHPKFNKLSCNTFDDIYNALLNLPEDELIKYRKNNM